MWRRVSCEQPLDTSQSILRLRGGLDQALSHTKGAKASNLSTQMMPKGNLVHIPEPGSGTVRTLVSVAATRNDLETPTAAPGRVFFSA